MSRNKQSRKYLIGRSYKDEFDWPFDLVIVTWKNNPYVDKYIKYQVNWLEKWMISLDYIYFSSPIQVIYNSNLNCQNELRVAKEKVLAKKCILNSSYPKNYLKPVFH